MICLQWWQIVIVLISMICSAVWGSNRAWNKGYYRGWQARSNTKSMQQIIQERKGRNTGRNMP